MATRQHNKVFTRVASFCFVVLCLLGISTIIYRNKLIISIGIKTLTALQITTLTSIFLTATWVLVAFIYDIKTDYNKHKLELETQEFAEKNKYTSVEPFIENLQRFLDTPHKKEAEQTIQLLVDIKDLESKFNRVIKDTKDEQLDIIQHIKLQLKNVKIKLAKDAEKIERRLTLNDNSEYITTLLTKNTKLMADAKDLTIQALNYMDVRTESTELDLDNLTDALKDLIKLI